MHKPEYIFAAIYNSFATRMKNDTPYLNLVMSIVIILFVHIMQVVLILKLFKFNLLENISRGQFALLFVLFCIVLGLTIKKIFPLKRIMKINVQSIDINKYNSRLIIYSFTSVLLLVVLFIFIK
jgi:hypothetical protein